MSAQPVPRKVKEIMTANPRTVAPTATVSDAYSLMIEGGFRHVVVVDGEKLVGVLSDRDVLQHMPPPGQTSIAAQGRFALAQVGELMNRRALSISGDDAIEDAVEMMLEGNISALVVSDGARQVAGIVTLVDFARLLGRLLKGLQ